MATHAQPLLDESEPDGQMGDAVFSVSNERRRPPCPGDESAGVTTLERSRQIAVAAAGSGVPSEAVLTVSGPSSIPCPGPGVSVQFAGVGVFAMLAALAGTPQSGVFETVVAGFLAVVATVAGRRGSVGGREKQFPNGGERR
jgi:hypothetical protein